MNARRIINRLLDLLDEFRLDDIEVHILTEDGYVYEPVQFSYDPAGKVLILSVLEREQ